MKFADFSFKNFKGINKMKLDLKESPNSNIYALVGLNESGKTTILEAISTYKSEEMPMTKETRNSKTNPNELIPLGKRANFIPGISVILIDAHYFFTGVMLSYARYGCKTRLKIFKR